MKSLEQILTDYLIFTTQTFPESTVESSLIKLTKEIQEVMIGHEIKDKENTVEEFADCISIIFDGAARAGFTINDLKKALVDKLEKNRKRTWTLNPDNTYSHDMNDWEDQKPN